MPRCLSMCVGRSANPSCVRTVSRAPRNPGATPSFTRTPRGTTLLREVADRECVGMIRCASARVNRINFQACSFQPLCNGRPSGTQRFRRPSPLGGPFGRQICARFVSSTHDGPDMWTPAHASKAVRAKQLPAWLSEKKTAALGKALEAPAWRRYSGRF